MENFHLRKTLIDSNVKVSCSLNHVHESKFTELFLIYVLIESLLYLNLFQQSKITDFWPSFHAYLCNSIPEVILNVLIAAGYDNALSISEFNEADIVTIESFTEENLRDVLETSKIYANVKPFVFLPGHKKLLIGLPNKLYSFKNRKCRKNLFATPKQEAQEIGSEPQVIGSEVEVVELLTDDEINSLKKKLVKKLNSRAQSFGIETLFSVENIVSDLEPYIIQARSALNKVTYKCSVKCVQCEVSKPCTCVGHWQVSNLEKHLKEHLKPTEKSSKSTSKNQHKESPAKTQSMSNQNQHELDSVLNNESE